MRMRIAPLLLALLLVALLVVGPAARAATVEVGQAAPNFRVGTAGEKTLELRQLRGKRVLVFFWATW